MAQKARYVPALGLDVLTPLYDPLVALTTRERAFKRLLIAQAGVRDGQSGIQGGLPAGPTQYTAWHDRALQGGETVTRRGAPA